MVILAHTRSRRAGVHLFPHPPSDLISHEVAFQGIVLRIKSQTIYAYIP
jgi:hypothetical protein